MFVFVIEYVCMVTGGVEFGEWDMKVPTFQLVIQHIYIMYNGLVMDYCVHFKLVQHLYNIPTSWKLHSEMGANKIETFFVNIISQHAIFCWVGSTMPYN